MNARISNCIHQNDIFTNKPQTSSFIIYSTKNYYLNQKNYFRSLFIYQLQTIIYLFYLFLELHF
jgi:hypothetical protein